MSIDVDDADVALEDLVAVLDLPRLGEPSPHKNKKVVDDCVGREKQVGKRGSINTLWAIPRQGIEGGLSMKLY